MTAAKDDPVRREVVLECVDALQEVVERVTDGIDDYTPAIAVECVRAVRKVLERPPYTASHGRRSSRRVVDTIRSWRS